MNELNELKKSWRRKEIKKIEETELKIKEIKLQKRKSQN